ncbi:MAG TPA: PQQ-binding-like beta-propeller repeat protein [Acidimicrobiales bacterium]
MLVPGDSRAKWARRGRAAACALTTMVGLAVAPAVAQAAPAPLSLSQTWFQTLNDAPCGLIMASPVEATLDGAGPSVEVGDRQGDIYAFHVASSSQTPNSPAGWETGSGSSVGAGEGCGISGNDGLLAQPQPSVDGIAVPGDPAIDSTASVMPGPNGLSQLTFGTGNVGEPFTGGYDAYGANGQLLWNQFVQNPPTDTSPGQAIVASPAVGTANGTPFVMAGSVGQEAYAFNAQTGATMPGWPFFSADSIFSTAAIGDLYGTGQDDIVVGGASSAGFAYEKHYQNGGHLRIVNDHGGLICSADTNEEVDSSPAVGPIFPNGGYGIATGTGSYYNGVSDQNTVKVFDTQCNQVWSQRVDGSTSGSPALADVTGSGALSVVEGTDGGGNNGSVYAFNGDTGAVLWRTSVIGAVDGSVTTADLTGAGYQDVIVPTTLGLEILDGQTGTEVADVDDGSGKGEATCADPPSCVYGFQNSALVTADPNGTIGITVAGSFLVKDSTNGDRQGMVQHFEVAGSNAALADAPGGWPQFHHDPGLTGFTGVPGSLLPRCVVPPAATNGYVLAASDGGMFTFGGQPFCGSTGAIHLNQPVVGLAEAPDAGGYWLAASDGGVFTFGSVQFYGSTGAIHLNKPVVGIASTPDARGYWLVASDGGVFTFGDAQYYGTAATTPNQNVVGLAPTPDGQGYWEVTSNGRVFAFGDAVYQRDAASFHLSAPIVAITPDPVTGGYWLVGADGGIFSFGAPFFGSTGSLRLVAPIVGMTSTDDGGGYWMVASDGGVFAFGDAPFSGSMGGVRLNRPVVGMSGY